MAVPPSPAPAPWQNKERSRRVRDRPLICHGAALDVNGAREAAGPFEGAAHLGQIASELDHDDGVGLAEAPLQLVLRKRAGKHREHVVALRHRCSDRRPASGHSTHARNDLGAKAVCQAHVQVHVGTIEQRVALTDHRHQATIIEIGGHVTCGGVVERADGIAIGCFVPRQLGGHWKRKRQFADAGFEKACGDAPGVSGVAGFGEMRDHVGLFQHPHRLKRDQLGIARSSVMVPRST